MPVGPQLPPTSELPPAQWADETLRRIGSDGLRRRPHLRRGGSGTHALLDGHPVVVFSSDDYLGLSVHPDVTEAAAAAARTLGVGATGARHLSGCHEEHAALEEELAAFVGAATATLAPTGHAACLAALQALGGADAVVLSDARNHAALVDGAHLSRGRLETFAHRDLDALEALLRTVSGRPVIASDAVFAMDGSVADVAGLLALAHRHGAWLVLGEAHAIGVLGPGGRGAATAANVDTTDPQLVTVLSLGTSLGAAGGAVLGSAQVRELLLHRGRALTTGTAPPHPTVAAARAALATLIRMPELVHRLRENARFLRREITGTPDDRSPAPILPVLCGEPRRALALERTLLRRGHLVQAVRPPAVPPGTSRVRISVTAAHTRAELRALAGDVLELGAVTGRAELRGKPLEAAIAVAGRATARTR